MKKKTYWINNKNNKPIRSMDLIKQDYSNACAELGDIFFQMEIAFPKRVKELQAKIEILSAEFKLASVVVPEQKPEQK